MENEKWRIIRNFARFLKNVLNDTIKVRASRLLNKLKLRMEKKCSMSALGCFVKRLTDIVVSGVGMIVLSPAFIIVWLVILCSGGHPIYRQERIGLHGKPFHILKFRTMKLDCEKNGIPRTEDERLAQMTCVGHFLRDHHLDEFPQLWNVFCGDMSLVGYRPERQYFIDQIMQLRPDYTRLYAIRPGLTSLATVYNGYTDTMEKMITRLDMDLEYLDNCSLGGDVKIIWKTISSILTGKKF